MRVLIVRLMNVEKARMNFTKLLSLVVVRVSAYSKCEICANQYSKGIASDVGDNALT
ncbi:hypothetical protein SAMN03084138_00763 [Enterovibrio norvegicus DSM 15893]|uniref:Uncharacterized protein n=1 Tax=Enterovibrio norvegicus DSM 15893 TaxID=1121869 RepID=A0A1I5KVC6_9GAMM|nr:hypothetical protein SAMN03084138_00763 [Enterovibrio norvegicus DSM 15893]